MRNNTPTNKAQRDVRTLQNIAMQLDAMIPGLFDERESASRQGAKQQQHQLRHNDATPRKGN